MKHTQAVFFDLDGTLVDTAPDLGYALNLQLARHGKPTLTDDVIRPYASHGSRGLLALGFGISPDDAQFIDMRDEYLELYNQVFTRQPRLFNGMEQVLIGLANQQVPWGIVTNKPRRFTQPLVMSMGLSKRAACVISGDDAPQPKPSPATLLMACAQTGVEPEHCIYVGDAERDIQAGKAAGMHTLVALFGYLDVNDTPDTWGADGMIHQPGDLLALLLAR
ncbi:MAG: phosphoglycolate phosphatase [Methylophilaceae bacterium 17-44-8]|nr:MAG: phosphoglycolate phosphatase [Methylophilales bacterium 28-44-11]OYZ03366.1 MAG: phosphoglycolate phosphatase [Methylophilales bacterium 16-45-7]OZA06607.1 MAG: phosphoglycolate phosphatase [Methylophilaceae bacterium 17-44-8]